MKRSKARKYTQIVIVLVFGLAHLQSAFASAWESTVGVKILILRKKPSFLSKETGRLEYGRIVKVLERNRGWSYISSGKSSGWVQTSSLGERESILKDLDRSAAESSATYKDEVATAGKGFSPEYERMLKNNNKKLNFDAVDKMESIEVPIFLLNEFRKTGNLKSAVLR